jgi:single-stranded-DNA-specific exonuclease
VPLDATFTLERNAWNGAVEPRLVLRRARGCAPAEIARLPATDRSYLERALAELEARLADDADTAAAPVATERPVAGRGPATRAVLDRRGESPLAVLVDAIAGGPSVLALCADVPRRLDGLRTRVGGFTLAGYGELEEDPARAATFAQLVALDPPAGPAAARLLRAGDGMTHLAWGEAELRFAEQMHELEYGLRTSLAAFYRSLRERGEVTGEELERLLRGEGPHGRSAPLAGRLIRVLTELELVSLDRDLPALAIASSAPTALERSPSFRAYHRRYEDGKRYLSSANQRRDD